MIVSNCLSSRLMSGLLAWRNPHGGEENWGNQQDGEECAGCGKFLITEIGLAILAAAAVVETIAYGALTLLSLPLCLATDRPCKFFAKLLQSSSFTILWSIADIIIFNPWYADVMTKESFARYWVGEGFTRQEDRLYYHEWTEAHPQINMPHAQLAPILAAGQQVGVVINQGADLLINDVLSDVDEDTKTRFMDMDPEMPLFIATKSVFIYGMGSKKEALIPCFFKPETIQAISDLRKTRAGLGTDEKRAQFDQEVEMFQQTFMKKFGLFSAWLAAGNANSIFDFNSLRGLGHRELNGLLVIKCWQKARDRLSLPPAAPTSSS